MSGDSLRVFILEDSRDRIYWFLGALPTNASICIATSVELAIECLGSDLGATYDVVFLDHDLGGEVYVDSGMPNTGYQVAKYIAENEIACGSIIIHTQNPVGAQNMLALLPTAQLIPFPTLIGVLGKMKED